GSLRTSATSAWPPTLARGTIPRGGRGGLAMHIILAILGALGVAAMIAWRISIAIHAAREIGDAAQGLANLPRKMRFQSRARREGVEVIADPREAATLLMLSVARAGGEVTASQK